MSSGSSSPQNLHTRLSLLVALVPIVPPLYVVALRAMTLWRELPLVAQRILLIFVGLQALSGLFTPEPLLSVPFALLRGIFIGAMICAGFYLSNTRAFQALLWGEIATVLIAIVTTFLRHGENFWNFRLEHPLYWPVSVGLSAAIAFLFAFVREDFSRAARASLISIAILGMLLSGSRAAQGAAVLGALVICLKLMNARAWRRFATSLGIALVISLGVAYLTPPTAVSSGQNPIARSVDTGLDLNGRGVIWGQAWKAFVEHPVGGVGVFQIGPYIPVLMLPCKLFPPVEPFGPCPPIMVRLNGAWNIAHNVFLHGLAETGILGLLGWLALLGFLGFAAFKSNEPLLLGLYATFMTVNMVDNSTLVPSPHYAEVFYVAMGIAVALFARAKTQNNVLEPAQSSVSHLEHAESVR